MGASELTLSIALVLGSISQSVATIEQEEMAYLNGSFQRWMGVDIICRFDDLPTKGGVPRFRIPYTGHDYPDKAGGTVAAMRKYDSAFHEGRRLATAFEQKDTTSQKEPNYERRGLFGRRRVRVDRTPGWHGHCNGWTAASIRHPEPRYSVVRNGVTFTPADIKGLLAEIYMYSPAEFLGGVGDTVNPGTFHIAICNWIGRASLPIGMETTPGEEKWNYPVYSYVYSFAKRTSKRVEVKMNVYYTKSSRREYQQSSHLRALMYFHYMLDLNDAGEIVGGEYFRDSKQLDLLWAPLQPIQGGEEGNKRGNPYVDVKEVLAIWRESVPEDLRLNWINIDPTDEDRYVAPVEDEEQPSASPPGERDVAATTEIVEYKVGRILVAHPDAIGFGLPGTWTRFTVTAVHGEWIGGQVVMGEGKLRGWVRRRTAESGFSPIGSGGEKEQQASASPPGEGTAEAAPGGVAWKAGQTVIVHANAVAFGLPGKWALTLAPGTRFTVTEVRSEWIGGEVVFEEGERKAGVGKRVAASGFSLIGRGEED
jgi:hypothetical protein